MKKTTKKRKRILPFLLAMALCVGLVAPSSALADDETSEETAAETTYAFGSDGIELAEGSYYVPVALMNATDTSTASAAADMLPTLGILNVEEDEEGNVVATLQTEIQEVAFGSLVGYASAIDVYQTAGTDGDTVAVTDVETETTDSYGDILTQATMTIPDITWDGIYVKLTVTGAVSMTPNAYIWIDYAHAVDATDADATTSYSGTAHVDQFGGYDVTATVYVKASDDGLNWEITEVSVEGSNYEGDYATVNQYKLSAAISGLVGNYVGVLTSDSDTLQNIINDEDVLDAVSGATYSATTISDAVLAALGLESVEEEIEVPDSVEEGQYTVTIAATTGVVAHSLVETSTAEASLAVDADGNMTLDFDVINGTSSEPLYVWGVDGYYDANGDLSTEDLKVTYSDIDFSDEYFDEDTQVVTHLSMPLTGDLSSEYIFNASIYVPVMNGLNGEIDGITFENGNFSVDSTITIYWDTLEEAKTEYYQVPASMMQATDPTSTSMGNAALEGYAIATVYGTDVSYEIPVQGVALSSLYGHLLNIYSYITTDYSSLSSETPTAATVSSTYTDTDLDGGTSEFARSFIITRDGMGQEESFYVLIDVDAMSVEQVALLAFDWSDATSITASEASSIASGWTTSSSSSSSSNSSSSDSSSSSSSNSSAVKTATVNGITYTVTSTSKKTAEVTASKKSITKAVIPATVKIGTTTYKVTSIAKNAFKGRSKLTTVTIGKNVKTIGANAFANCKKLKKVTIGKSVTTIGKKAFYKDKKLTKVTFKGTKVKSIGKQAFKGTSKKAAFKTGKAKYKKYKKLIKKAGAPSSATYKK